MKTVPLTNNYHFALVDDDDYDRVNKHSWFAHVYKHTLYVKAVIGGEIVSLHRLVMNLEPDEEVDHRNRCGSDCRKSNLRHCTHQQNCCNRVMPQGVNGSGFRGVEKNKQKWMARIRVDGKSLYLGTFVTKEEAAKAYDVAAKQHHGEFAVLNFG